MLLFILSTSCNVIEICKNSFDIILVHILLYFSVETGHALSYSKRQPGKLVEAVSDFGGYVGLVLVIKWHSMIGNKQVDGANAFVLSNVVFQFTYP